MVTRQSQHGSLTLNGDGSYTLVGSATVTGTNPFTVTLPVSTAAPTVDMAGAGGTNYSNVGKTGGYGARVQATLTITGGTAMTAKIGKQTADDGTLTGGYGGGAGGSGTNVSFDMRRPGGGSTSLAWSGIVELEAGGGAGASWNTYGEHGQGYTDDTGGGNSTAASGTGSGGGWHSGASPSSPSDPSKGGSSNIESPASGSYTSGYRTGNGYMTLVW